MTLNVAYPFVEMNCAWRMVPGFSAGTNSTGVKNNRYARMMAPRVVLKPLVSFQ